MLLSRRPTQVEEYTAHPSIVQKMVRYAHQKSILHTTFYGPHGSGKYSLCLLLIAEHMRVPIAAVQKVHGHAYGYKEKEYTFYKSQYHFEIDVAHFLVHQQKAIVDIIQDLGKTMNVSINRYKIIVLRNSELLTRGIQHQLRRMIETLYKTARLIFICHNIDSLDDTIRSRMLLVSVPAPETDVVVQIVSSNCKYDPSIVSDSSLRQIVEACDHNMHRTLLKTYMLHANVTNELQQIIDTLWRYITSAKNNLIAVRKLLRVITITRVPWSEVLHGIIAKLYEHHAKCPDIIECAIETCCYYMYLYEVGYRKEVQLEILVVSICELLWRKKLQSYRDWV